jgi:NNP family nitrate/nitrite transporter-like MFS transporter
MIPSMLRAPCDAAAVIGISSAIGALGGFFIPRSLGVSIKATGGAGHAFAWFLAGYALWAVITWWVYRRTRTVAQPVPAPAEATT